MSVVLAGAFGAACLLLLVAGATKVADPTRTVGALAASDWPVSPVVVRLGAAAEALLGAAGLVVGGAPVAVGVILSYVGFTVFVVIALRRGAPIGSCGCLGSADTPPSSGHVAVDVALAAGTLAALVAGEVGPLVDAGAAAGGLAIVFAVGAYLAMTRRPSDPPSP